MKIISKGIAVETEVYDDSGKRMDNVTKVVIEPITAESGFVKATLTFEDVELDMDIIGDTD